MLYVSQRAVLTGMLRPCRRAHGAAQGALHYETCIRRQTCSRRQALNAKQRCTVRWCLVRKFVSGQHASYYGHKQTSTYDKSFRIRSEVFNDNHFSLHSLICNLFTGLTSRGREVATGRPTVKRRIATYAIMPECLCFGELNGAAPGPGDMTSLSSR